MAKQTNKYDKGVSKGSNRSDAYSPMSITEQNKHQILLNLEKKGGKGLISKAIDGVCTMTTFKKYCRDDADFEEKVNEIKLAMEEVLKDKIEERMLDAILDDDKPLTKNQTELVKMYLKTKAKDRGYTEKDAMKEDEGAQQINIQYIVPKQIDNIEDQNIQIEDNE